MKNFILLLIYIVLNSQLLLALENTSGVSTQVAKDLALFTKGYHLGALVPPNNFQVMENAGTDRHFQISSPLALSIGYTSLESQRFGWSTQVNFASLRDPNLSQRVSFLRWDGNLAYSINSVYSIKIGPNVTRRFGATKFSRSGDELMRSHGLGYQAHLNVRATSHLLVNIGYSETTAPNLGGEGFRISGPELEMAYLC
jgi:hypothetical protein